jgi:hypothetical protein
MKGMKQWWLVGIIVLLVGVAGVLGYVLVGMQSGELNGGSMGRGWLGRLVGQERAER